jgi:colicin import membrane protein
MFHLGLFTFNPFGVGALFLVQESTRFHTTKKSVFSFTIHNSDMWDNIISFTNAIILHLLVLGIMFVKMESLSTPRLTLSIAPENIMHAVAIDENQWIAAISSMKSDEVPENLMQHKLDKQLLEQTVIKETQRLNDLREQKETEQQRLAEIKQHQEAEEAALEQLKREQAEEQARLEREAQEEREWAEQLEREKQQLEELEEEIRQAEQERLAIEADEKWEVEEPARLEQEPEEIEQEEEYLAIEAEEMAARQAEQLIQEVTSRIQQKVEGQWERPSGFNYRGLSCVIEIRLKSGGGVKKAKIVTSSGNIAFDSSAIRAIYQASPLPVDDEVFDTFRHFYFRFSK